MRSLVLASTVPLVLLLGACGGGAATTTDEPSSSTAAGSRDGAGEKVDNKADGTGQVPALLDFTGVTVEGERFAGSTLVGRPTVLWFWAPWCPTCRGQVPQVEALEAEHAGDLNVVGVGSLDSAEAIAEFADGVSSVTHLEDVDGELWKRFGVTEQSSFVVLDADGAVAFEAGYGGTDELDAQVESLLG